VNLVGAGSHPETSALSVCPTTVEPVIFGVGDVVNGIPAAIGAVAFEVLLVVIYPDLVAVART
jgi:hypothetical protein